MEQSILRRALQLIALLSGPRIYTIKELADKLEISQRTVYRYLDTFKEAGFALEKVADYQYRLLSVGGGVSDISNILYFSDEEAYLVNKLIDSLDPTNSLRAGLKQKLATIYDRTSIVTRVDNTDVSKIVETIEVAIRERKVVDLQGYSSSYSGQTRDYRVEPFEFTPNFAGFWAYDLVAGLNKRFKILRLQNVVLTDDAWTMSHAHHATPMDAFRIHGEVEYHIILRLNTVAKNLMIEEYPLTEPYISPQNGLDGLGEDFLSQQVLILPDHDMEDEVEEFWIYEGTVRGIDGIGRFVLGLEGNVEVLEGEELIAYLKAHAKHVLETYED